MRKFILTTRRDGNTVSFIYESEGGALNEAQRGDTIIAVDVLGISHVTVRNDYITGGIKLEHRARDYNTNE